MNNESQSNTVSFFFDGGDDSKWHSEGTYHANKPNSSHPRIPWSIVVVALFFLSFLLGGKMFPAFSISAGLGLCLLSGVTLSIGVFIGMWIKAKQAGKVFVQAMEDTTREMGRLKVNALCLASILAKKAAFEAIDKHIPDWQKTEETMNSICQSVETSVNTEMEGINLGANSGNMRN